MPEPRKLPPAPKRVRSSQSFVRASKVDLPTKKPLPFNGGPHTKEWLNAISLKMRKTVSHALTELVKRVHGDAALQKRIQNFKDKYPAEPPMKQVNLLVAVATHQQLEDLHYGAGMHAKSEYLRLLVAYFAHRDFRDVCRTQRSC